ncbi:MAG: Rnf-Nqr domain containing protein [Ruminococcus sp.]|nr:Rnf-Nqr domain containing protein [Oscillospiraceae bacterium]
MFLIVSFLSQLAGNLIFTQALGTSTVFISAKNKRSFMGVAFIICIFTTFGSMGAYFADRLLNGYFENFRLFAYVLITGIIYLSSLFILWCISKRLYGRLKKYIHISSFNCAVMGTLYMISENPENTNISDYLLYGLQSGLGFIIASVFVATAYKRLNCAKVPSSFRGMPAMLVYLGIISMAVWTLK